MPVATQKRTGRSGEPKGHNRKDACAMKNRSFVPVFCVTALNLLAVMHAVAQAPAVPNKDTSIPESLQVLRLELLGAKDDQARLDSIKKIASLGEGDAVTFLMDYFKDLPLPQPSTNPYIDSFRLKALDLILPVLGDHDRDGFLVSVIKREADGLREAASFRAGNMYSGLVWDKALGALERCVSPAETLRELAAMADDRSVPDRLRVAVKTRLILNEAGKDESAICKKIREILKELPIRPMTSMIPYDIYYDKDKRIAYGGSASYKERNLEFARWRDSGKLAEFETSMSVLLTHGLVSVREILAVIRRDDVPKERRDCLAMVAASVLARLSVNMKRDGEQAGEECRLLVESLANYVDQMDDPGVFSFRNCAETGLLVFYRNTGMDEFRFSSGRQQHMDALAAAGGETPGIAGKVLSKSTEGKLYRDPTEDVGKENHAQREEGLSFQVLKGKCHKIMVWVLSFFGCVTLLSCAGFLRGRLTRKSKV